MIWKEINRRKREENWEAEQGSNTKIMQHRNTRGVE